MEDDQHAEPTEPVLLAAADVANPFGAALPWPEADGAHLGRGAGALVVLSEGRCIAHLTRGGRGITTFAAPSFADEGGAGAGSSGGGGAASGGTRGVDGGSPATISGIISALTTAIRAGRLSPVVIERINGHNVMDVPTREWIAAGTRLTPKGLSIK